MEEPGPGHPAGTDGAPAGAQDHPLVLLSPQLPWRPPTGNGSPPRKDGADFVLMLLQKGKKQAHHCFIKVSFPLLRFIKVNSFLTNMILRKVFN